MKSDLDPIIFGIATGCIIVAVLTAGHALWEKVTKKKEPHRG